jgi:hypothetical protein
MTGVTLNANDAAELAEMLQFLADWLKRDPGRLGRRWKTSSAIPPTTPASCARTWTSSSSCSAAATANPSSARCGEPPSASPRRVHRLGSKAQSQSGNTRVRRPRACNPVAGPRSQSRVLAALASCGWRYAQPLSVIFPGKDPAPIERTGIE